MLIKSENQNSSFQVIASNQITQGELIGSGGYGDVYKGTWHGITVAIKQLHLKKLSSDLEEAFQHEANLLSKCNFPNIIGLYGVFFEPGAYAMVMEHMPKGSLYDFLHSKQAFPWQPMRWQIAQEIAKGLNYLHSNQIIHQDLKSLNVLLDENYHAKISDFGMAKIKLETKSTSTHSSKDEHQKGSTRWRAPELFKRRSQPTFASDMYSYGVVLWEIATRELPFKDALDEQTVISWVSNGEKEDIPKDCPVEYAQMIQSCWNEASQRPSAQMIVEQLSKIAPKPIIKNLKPKPWHFSTDVKQAIVNSNDNNQTVGNYQLLPASQEDYDKVMLHYAHHPVAKMDIKSVKVIYNPELNRAFESRVTLLQARHGNPAFAPKWHMNNDENNDQRVEINNLLEKLTQPHKDVDRPNVKILAAWHGTKNEVLPSIFESGYANLATTDKGFFGKGIYSSYEAEYAYRVYSKKGALIMNWVSCFSAYPTIFNDMPKLTGQANYGNYDAHFVPVVPPGGEHSFDETIYYPCQPNQLYQYIEMVVFDAQQCLPRYLVELQPSLPKPLSLLPQQPKVTDSEKTNHAAVDGFENLTKEHEKLTEEFEKLIDDLEEKSSSKYPALYKKYLADQLKEIPGEASYKQGFELYLKCRDRESLQYFEQAAEANYPPAFLRLEYLYGSNVLTDKKDENKAKYYHEKATLYFEWFEDQAKNNDPLAWNNLGKCYGEGIGVAQNAQKAFHWYHKAAEAGFSIAQYNLGYCYSQGVGVEKNLKQAFFWYQKAADQGYSLGQYSLGLCYEHGRGVDKSIRQALDLYRMAADKGLDWAQFKLGYYHEMQVGIGNMGNIDKNIENAQLTVFWYQKAAEQGHVTAQYSLGNTYDDYKSKYFEKDYSKAFSWYQKAADQGDHRAQYKLGACYMKGKGVDKNEKLGIFWLLKAAEKGNSGAQFSLGVYYSEGKGVEIDHEKAIFFFEEAYRGGMETSAASQLYTRYQRSPSYKNVVNQTYFGKQSVSNPSQSNSNQNHVSDVLPSERSLRN